MEKIRKYPRMDAEFILAYRRPDDPADPSAHRLAKTRTVGLGGVMFEAEEEFAPGTALHVELVVEQRRIEASVRVVYAEREREGLYRTGVEFTGIDEDDRDFLLSYYLQKEYRIAPEGL